MRSIPAKQAERDEPAKMSKLYCLKTNAIGACAALAAPILLTAALAAVDGGWAAELRGPVQRCQVPQRILFVAFDAIISGKITFRGKTYYPRGRLEDTLETELSLVTRYGDPTPLVVIAAKADGSWNGEWMSPGKDCAGRVRILPR
jgi:hypothetical protein